MTEPSRRDQILQAFVFMLETNPGARITTAALAKEVGVSEAALYRHFPSKAKMLEGLIEFVEESLFPRITRILADETDISVRCRQIATLILTFAERNPGFARLLVGDVLQGETERLRARMRQVFDRLETQLRQVIREWATTRVPAPALLPHNAANLILATTEGRINQFVRSEFKSSPTQGWDEQWQALANVLFETT